ncbi:Uncharacterized protein TCM_011785 [Theobroma cacao]|uniref:Uncharacterized protein n=1 Tax=Theobroma cacao TaxID=3641 RepID=A0A061EAK3_THECC|nr:Uncharacterized protein TCM_011785 [Theobroma cacao]
MTVGDNAPCSTNKYRFPIDLLQLETLYLNYFFDWKLGLILGRLPTHYDPRNLLILKVFIPQLDLLWIADVLKVCPLMQKLELHL